MKRLFFSILAFPAFALGIASASPHTSIVVWNKSIGTERAGVNATVSVLFAVGYQSQDYGGDGLLNGVIFDY